MRDFLYRILRILRNRIFLIALGMIAAFLVVWIALYRTQITNYEHYTELQEENYYSEQSVSAERGCIYDRYGRPLAVNEESQTLFYLPSISNEDLMGAIESILVILNKNGETLSLKTEFPIGYAENRGYYFIDSYTRSANEIGHDNFLAEVYNTSRDELTEEQKETDATTCMKILCEERFTISMDTHEPAELVRIVSVRYAIFSGRFDTSVSVQIASDISEETEVEIRERGNTFSGFSVQTVYSRYYPEGELFAHIVGYVGQISEDELADKQSEGLDYSENDSIGKTGLEAVYESSLRGTSGTVRTETDADTGAVVNSVTVKQTVQGDSIYLTIDRDLQESTYNALKDQIKSLLISKITGVSGEAGATYSAVDIYTALIDNHFLSSSMIDFNSEDSGSYAGDYLTAFRSCCSSAKESSAEDMIDLVLNTRTPVGEFDDWQKDLYDMLITNMRDEVHLSYDYQEDETFYPDYADGKTAPYDFFVYCLENNCIDESIYGIEKSDSTDTIILKILNYELAEVQKLDDFNSFVYSYVLSTERFPQKSFLYLMYEQGLITDSDGSREALENNTMTEIDVLKLKIQEDEITPADINLDPCSGSVVITDPDSGEVLAMVSYPSYDPNLFMNSSDYYYDIIDDKSGPLSFRALEELRAVGSTFKMCVAVAGLDTGVITKTTEIYDDTTFPYANTESEPSCWSSVSHGSINVVQALDYSCNYFFYQVGFLLSDPVPATSSDPVFGPLSTRESKYRFDDSVGLEKLKYYSDLLGLSTRTGIELSESTPIASTLDAVRSAIGQGNGSYSCANLNRYTDTLANGGHVYNLYLVDEIRTSEGASVYRAEPVLDHETGISEEILETVKEGMRLVVTDDHGTDFAGLESYGILCAGKTGTAQEDEDRPDHSLFTGYTNLNDPELCISVIIPFGGGSKNAIPVFIDIAADYYGVSLDR